MTGWTGDVPVSASVSGVIWDKGRPCPLGAKPSPCSDSGVVARASRARTVFPPLSSATSAAPLAGTGSPDGLRERISRNDV
mmetsp:Transcript_92035/g.232318  ORF Transcript_92035/g.232318 Transcript_92035/m.232318 type:complete len:81 (-) Transcript_92035:292-534(-)